MWCWGGNYYGELGDGTNKNKKIKPVQEKWNVKTWKPPSTGFSHTCGTRTDGSLWCWGYNYYGQLGDGTNTDVSQPKEVIK